MTRLEHLLTILSEECHEVGQRATKAARFGLAEIQPEQPLNNAERLQQEWLDLTAVIRMLYKENEAVFNFAHWSIDEETIAMKQAKVEKYLEYSRTLGTLEPKP